jgi:hypothetical protein
MFSGASGTGAANGLFGTWRGTPLQIGGTWNDSRDAQVNQWTLWPQYEWGTWSGPLDVAIGAIYKPSGETWAAAASGAYDTRWEAALRAIKTRWGSRPQSNLYLRFAHEFNGSWMPWSVTGTEAADFVRTWKRFRTVQLAQLPDAKLVLCPNDGTSTSLKLDWRKCFPGAGYVNVMGVDTYNAWPWVNTVEGFAAKIQRRDPYGAPVGIETHRIHAYNVGLPLAICEWANDVTQNGGKGDSPVYISEMKKWFDKNAGTGRGQVLYEIYFNVASYNNGAYAIYPTTKQPSAAATYKTVF